MDQRDFEELIDNLKEKALNGDVEAMRNLGDAYYQGPTGKENNVAAAFPYWKKAADNGDTFIAVKVGYAFLRGDGCQEDEVEAFSYFQMAADAGNRDAQFNVGYCCEHGIGCSVSETNAKKYYEMAALAGHGESQWHLGTLQFLAKEGDWLHWICCAHLSGISEATDFLNHMIENGTDHDVLQYQIKLIESNGIDPRNSRSARTSSSGDSGSGGCYIATCVYGSYDCPEVWTLRRFRDNSLNATWYGRAFVCIYYAVSPTLVKWFGDTTWFKRFWRGKLDGIVKRLQDNGIESTPYQDDMF